jgi:hypothetical protein
VKTARDPKLTERLVLPGSRVMKLDADKGKPPKFPFLQKKRKERHDTLEHMRRVGRVSMIQIGDDEFRTPSRAERRAAGIRHRGSHNVLTLIAAKRGIASLKQPIGSITRVQPIGRTYTRKAKRLRKAIIERNATVEAWYELIKVYALVHRARGFVGSVPLTIE